MADRKTSDENDAGVPLNGNELVRVSVLPSSTGSIQSAKTTTQDIANLAIDPAVAEAVATARTPGVQSVASASTVTPNFDTDDLVKITAQAAALTLANPTGTGTPHEGQGMAIRIKDNATARAISYGTKYRGIGVSLPTTTVISKLLYLGMIYNATDDKWDVVSVIQEA